MTHKMKMVLGWVCYRIIISVPSAWWSALRLDSEVLAWAGYYANAPEHMEHRP